MATWTLPNISHPIMMTHHNHALSISYEMPNITLGLEALKICWCATSAFIRLHRNVGDQKDTINQSWAPEKCNIHDFTTESSKHLSIIALTCSLLALQSTLHTQDRSNSQLHAFMKWSADHDDCPGHLHSQHITPKISDNGSLCNTNPGLHGENKLSLAQEIRKAATSASQISWRPCLAWALGLQALHSKYLLHKNCKPLCALF